MSTTQKMDVSVNIAQDFNDAQKAQARTNIGAAAASDLSNKMDKVSGATAGDVATLDVNGNVVDSGVTLDPSTNTIAANISGNAATASEAASGSTLESKINSKQEAITWMTDAEALQLWTDAWNAAT